MHSGGNGNFLFSPSLPQNLTINNNSYETVISGNAQAGMNESSTDVNNWANKQVWQSENAIA